MKSINNISDSSWRILLFPLTLFYVLIIYFKNKLYDFNIIKIRKFNTYIISAGNISTGGTGKSPFVLSLAKKFLIMQKKVCIISRGYLRETKDQVIVFDGEKFENSPRISGDEPLMIASRLIKEGFKNFIFISDSDKIRAIETAERKFMVDVIILDDAFQQRKIFKNIDIVLLDIPLLSKNRLIDKICLPAGNLREPFNNLKRADIIIANQKNMIGKDIFRLTANHYVISAHYVISGIYNDEGNKLVRDNQNIITFCGLADDSSFIEAVNSYNLKIIRHMKFQDHHDYKTNDVENIKKYFIENTIYITTEKDFIKIRSYYDFIKDYPVYYLKIDLDTEWDKILNFSDN